MLVQTREKVHSNGYQMIATERSHLFQFPVSHYSLQPGVFRIVLHVPIMKDESELRVFSYVPLPIPVSDKSLVSFVPEQSIIAVRDDDKYFRTMSTADLAKCSKVGDHFNCPNANTRMAANKESIIEFSPEARCSYHMWRRQLSLAEEHCTKELSGLYNAVFQVGSDRFVAYTTETRQVTVDCPNNDPIKAEVYAPRTDFTLADGCSAKVADLMVGTADLTILGTGRVQPIQWDSAPELVLQGLNITWFEQQRDSGRTMPHNIREATELMKRDQAIALLDSEQEGMEDTQDKLKAAAATALLWSKVEAIPIAGGLAGITLLIVKATVRHMATKRRIQDKCDEVAAEAGQLKSSRRSEAGPAQAIQCFSVSDVSRRSSLQHTRSSHSTYAAGESRSGPLLPPRRRAPASEPVYASTQDAPEAPECNVHRNVPGEQVFSA
jgi:hypothetical protein